MYDANTSPHLTGKVENLEFPKTRKPWSYFFQVFRAVSLKIYPVVNTGEIQKLREMNFEGTCKPT